MTKPTLLTGAEFRQLRKSKKIGINRLSQQTGVSTLLIRRYESGENMTIKTYLKLLTALQNVNNR